MTTAVQQAHSKKAQGLIFTEAAKNHFLQYLTKTDDAIGLRLFLSKTGCSGLSYEFSAVSEANPSDLVFELQAPYQLFIERKSYPMIQGTRVDFVKEGLNQRLVYDNPNQTGQCGCGESFTVND